MRSWIEDALDLLEREPRIALISVVAVAGSAPREAGAKMLVTATGERGTIGGGTLEHTCIAQARALLARPDEMSRAQDYPLGPLLGQCCGGRVRVALEVLTPADRTWLVEAATQETHGRPYQLILPLRGERRVMRGWPTDTTQPMVMLRDDTGSTLPPESRQTWTQRAEFVRPTSRRILLIGGGHVGAALAQIFRQLPTHLTWIDPRPLEQDDGAAMGGARLSPDPVRDVGAAAPNAVFLVMTHSHALDFDLVAAVLRRGDSLYCGVIGSKTKRQRFLNRLAQSGFTEAQRAQLVCPIGNVGLVGKEPSVIALAVATEIMLRFEAHEADG
jgi:xanthine dehydrogenase accessory factor